MTHFDAIVREWGMSRAAVAWRDLETGEQGGWRDGEWFHAASTFKVAVLAAVVEHLPSDEVLLVHNGFRSAAGGEPFEVSMERDHDKQLHELIGQKRSVEDLARRMTAKSGNLATNLLLERLGVERVRAMGLEGIDVVRGVEDMRAHEAGIANRVTAAGLADFFAALRPGRMMDILLEQELKDGIGAALPAGVPVASKTGQTDRVAHDAGLVMLPGRQPFALAVLTEWPEPDEHRWQGVRALVRVIMGTHT